MPKIGISVYAFRIQSMETAQMYELNSMVESKKFIEVMSEFLENYSSSFLNNPKMEKVFKVDEYNIETYSNDGVNFFKYAVGKIKTGAYGYSADILDASTGIINYQKGINDAEVLPFSFILSVPNGHVDRGLLILQNHGIYGMKRIFEDSLQKYLKTVDGDYKLTVGTVTPREYVERFLEEGILQKIKFIRYNIPNDRANEIGINNGVETSSDEYVINAPVGFIQRKKDKIKEVIRGQRSVNHIVEIQGFDYDNIKLEFKLGKSIKTINLSNIDSIVISEDVTELVELCNGHPTKESLIPILIKTSKEYLDDMGLI